jgi:CRP-like cAMP-binding protein
MALKSCPWVLDELRPLADRLQALAGATMGPLGELDEAARGKVIDRMTIRVVQPHEIITEQGQKLPWLAVVGAGAVELLKGEPPRVTGEVGAGDFVFPGVVVRDLPAPTTIRAGAAGAILLTGDQALARDILTGSPPLIGILGE